MKIVLSDHLLHCSVIAWFQQSQKWSQTASPFFSFFCDVVRIHPHVPHTWTICTHLQITTEMQ